MEKCWRNKKINMNGINFNLPPAAEIEKNPSPQKKKGESTTSFPNETAEDLNFCPTTTEIKSKNYKTNEDSKKFNANMSVVDRTSLVLRYSSKMPVAASLRHIFQGRKLAAEKLVEEKKSSLVATSTTMVAPSASFVSSKNIRYDSFNEVCDAKRQTDEVKSTSEEDEVQFLKSSEGKKNANADKVPTQTSSLYEDGLNPHYFCEVEENNFEADWSTGLSLIGGNAETTDMFLATWLEKINRKN